MTSTFHRICRIGVILLSLILGNMLALAETALGATLTFSPPKTIENLRPNKHAQLNQKAYKLLQEAQTQSYEGNYQESLNNIAALIKRYDKNPVIVSLALRSASQTLLEQEEYAQAAKQLHTILKLASLDKKSLSSLRQLLAQVYFQQQQYQDAIDQLTRWLASAEQPQTNDYLLLAYAWYELKNCQQAIKAAENGMKKLKTEAASLLKIMLSCQLDNKNYSQADNTLARLVKIEPKNRQYWSQWANVKQMRDQSKAAAAIFEIMEENQHLTTPESRLRYVHLLLQQNNPERAAKKLAHFLDQGLIETKYEHQKLLAHAWEKAGHIDKAIEVLSNQTSDENNTDRLKMLTRLYVYQEDWQALINQLEKQLGKDPKMFPTEKITKDTEMVLLQLGHAYAETKNINKAKSLFSRLSEKPELSESTYKHAQEWLDYIEFR